MLTATLCVRVILTTSHNVALHYTAIYYQFLQGYLTLSEELVYNKTCSCVERQVS
jgi:hypothetical protein